MEFQTIWIPKPLKSTISAMIIPDKSQGKQKMCETLKMILSLLGLDRALRTKKNAFHLVPCGEGSASLISKKQGPLIRHIWDW